MSYFFVETVAFGVHGASCEARDLVAYFLKLFDRHLLFSGDTQ